MPACVAPLDCLAKRGTKEDRLRNLRSWILLLGVAAAVFAGGCNDFNTTLGTPTNSSTISLLSPSGANAGGGAITLTVEGTGFLSNSVVEWNGSNRVTTYI